jgi:predicted nucleic acid-binding protein
VTADEVYVDASALTRLYVHQEGSREMSVWRAKINGALPVTRHGRTEITNAICRAAFRGHISEHHLPVTLEQLSLDFANARLVQAEILWRAALNRASDLSREFTPTIGTRALDVLHVACAVELASRFFLTFNMKQRQLAEAVGLKTLKLR